MLCQVLTAVNVKIKLIHGCEAAESSTLKTETGGFSEISVPSTKLYGITILQDRGHNTSDLFAWVIYKM